MIVFKSHKYFNKDEINIILDWRNHPSIRKWMTNANIISKQEHLKYIDYLKTTDFQELYLYYQKNRPIGVLTIDRRSDVQQPQIGMYVSPDYINTGAGIMLGFYGASFLFNEKKFERISLSVQKQNKAVLKLWDILGIERLNDDSKKIDTVQGFLTKSDFQEWPKTYKAFLQQRIIAVNNNENI